MQSEEVLLEQSFGGKGCVALFAFRPQAPTAMPPLPPAAALLDRPQPNSVSGPTLAAEIQFTK
jgi:hypothetical protein